MAAAQRSMPEWAASESIPREPVMTPVSSLSSVMMSAAKTDSRAAERFAAWVRAASSGGAMEAIGKMLHGSGFGGTVETGSAEGVAGPGCVSEACVGNQLDHARGAGEAGHGVGEIGVGCRVSRDEAAEARKDLLEVEVIERAGKAGGLVEVEDADLAAGAQDAVEFGETCLVVAQVTEAEGRGDEVDGVVGDGEMESIGLDGDDVVGGELLGSAR